MRELWPCGNLHSGRLHFSFERTSFSLVKITVEIDYNRYYRLLARCEMSSRDYAIMKNSVVSTDGEHGQEHGMVTIVCEVGEAKMLLNHASRFYPDAVPNIEKSIALAREP